MGLFLVVVYPNHFAYLRLSAMLVVCSVVLLYETFLSFFSIPDLNVLLHSISTMDRFSWLIHIDVQIIAGS